LIDLLIDLLIYCTRVCVISTGVSCFLCVSVFCMLVLTVCCFNF